MAILYHKKFKSSIKIAVFKNTTFPRHKGLRGTRNDLIAFYLSNLLGFELCVYIGFPIKNRPCGRFCKSWLCSVCSSRAELLEIGQEIDNVKDKLNLSNLW